MFFGSAGVFGLGGELSGNPSLFLAARIILFIDLLLAVILAIITLSGKE